MEWFYYNGTGGPCEPLSYSPALQPNCPAPKQKLCAIKAIRQLISGQPQPIITPEKCAEILAALLTSTESACVLLKPN